MPVLTCRALHSTAITTITMIITTIITTTIIVIIKGKKSHTF